MDNTGQEDIRQVMLARLYQQQQIELSEAREQTARQQLARVRDDMHAARSMVWGVVAGSTVMTIAILIVKYVVLK
jgi:hypothetical protein